MKFGDMEMSNIDPYSNCSYIYICMFYLYLSNLFYFVELGLIS